MLVIGTANPPNSLSQEEYTDWYFCVTNSDHLTNLKDKMKKICEFLITKYSLNVRITPIDNDVRMCDIYTTIDNDGI
uniref:chalcone synthase n=1 Tax=Oryza sativa subsp. japonica TaxID=39947 RepID=Q2R3B1_ORYSJ|nr:hypothetical protein LOC_Os11g32550 [Oryza sativa Japonica Group]